MLGSRFYYHLSAFETIVNVPFKLVPIACAAARNMIETKTAIRAYSIAVPPVSSCINRRTVFIDNSLSAIFEVKLTLKIR